MTSSGSSKELARALAAFLQAPTLPLPDDVNAIIATYLEKHNNPDEGSGERLGDELLTIWDKIVHDHPERYAAFLAILRQLRPGLRTPARVFKWWDKLLDPVLDHVGREKGLAREVMGHTLDLFSADEYDDPAAWSEEGLMPLVNRLLTIWMDLRETQAGLRPSTDLKEQMIRDALLAFGKRDPKGFMTALNGFVVKREHRNQALSLLCAFVSSGPPHLHLILQTPLFQSILHSLQKDESTATVNLALISLVMILPSIPSSLVPLLPTLFNIYARLLFWDRDSYFAQRHTEMGAENGEAGAAVPWDKSLLDPDYDGNSLSYLSEYFSVLYGLYPLNFLDYIRKPQRYLRHANNAEDIDVQAMEIRDRSERFRKQHILHPNFYHLTIESEKTDMSRWIKSEADEVLADCMALVIDQNPGLSQAGRVTTVPQTSSSAAGDGAELEGFESALLNSSVYADSSYRAILARSLSPSRANSVSLRRGSFGSQPSGFEVPESRSRGPGDNSPILPPHLSRSASHSQIQEAIQPSNTAKKGLHQSLAGDSVPSLVPSTQEQAAEKNPQHDSSANRGSEYKTYSAGLEDQLALLHHNQLRLINDLQYERFIKQQHMIHMGELRRRQIRVSATEAETQNLVMANRSLKQRLDDAKKSEAQIKKEFDHRRGMAKKWESDLSNKLRALREEQKKWNTEGNELRQQLQKVQAECESLSRIIQDAEIKRLEYEQNLEAVDISTAMTERLKAEIARLSAAERAFQGKETRLETAMQEAAAAEARAQQLAHEAAARQEQLLKAESHYESEIEDLRAQLAQAVQESRRKPAGDVAAAYASALSSARAKNEELQKLYDDLMKKYTALQSSLLEMQCNAAQGRGRSEADPAPPTGSPQADRTAMAARSRQRGFSDPESVGGLTQSAGSPPTEPASTSPETTSHRPVSPPGQTGPSEPPGAVKTSPQTQRYFGRGGVQNSARKERKDKKDEASDKKDKKPGAGLGVLRSLV